MGKVTILLKGEFDDAYERWETDQAPIFLAKLRALCAEYKVEVEEI